MIFMAKQVANERVRGVHFYDRQTSLTHAQMEHTSMFRTSNPALNNDAFKPSQSWDDVYGPNQSPQQAERAAVAAAKPSHMTISGVIQKSAFMIGLTVFAAAGAWHLTLPEAAGGMGILSPMIAFIGTFFIGMPLLLLASFKPKLSVFCAPPFAIVVGLFAGSFSAVVATYLGSSSEDGSGIEVNQGIVLNAMLLTMAIFVGMLGAYATKIIRPGKVFYAVVINGTIGVMLYGLAAMLLHFTGISSTLASVYSIENGGLISIGFSVFVVALASLNLVLDFDQIAIGERNKAPKYMEWYSSMALLVTLVWLYIEVLRLLAKLQSRD